MVKRRKVLFGIGALAAGGAAATATGAFSSAQMNREANINVVNDAQGLIALRPDNTTGHSSGSSVYENDNGELEIDFSGDGDAGVNVNSRYIVGSFHHGDVGSGPNQIDDRHVYDSNDGANGGTIHSSTMGAWGYAFSVTNQDTEEHDVSISFEATEDIGEGYLGFHAETGWSSGETLEIQGANTDGSLEFPDVPSGETIRVSFVVSTIDVEDYEDVDLSGSLTVSAD